MSETTKTALTSSVSMEAAARVWYMRRNSLMNIANLLEEACWEEKDFPRHRITNPLQVVMQTLERIAHIPEGVLPPEEVSEIWGDLIIVHTSLVTLLGEYDLTYPDRVPAEEQPAEGADPKEGEVAGFPAADLAADRVLN